MRRLAGIAALALVASASALAMHAQTTPQAVFRTNTDLVTVPVFVKGNDGRLGSLRAEDFQLTDNGVRQKIESVEAQALPIDVTVIVEASRAMTGYEESLREQVRKIAALVRPTDRLEVLGIGDYVNVIVPLAPASAAKTIPQLTFDGMASVNDTLTAALLRQPDPDRRHLIIALTDTVDTMSSTSMETVKSVAAKSGATLVIAWITMSADGPPAPGVPWATVSERLAKHVRGPRTLGAVSMLAPSSLPPFLSTNRSSEVMVGRTVPPRQQWTPHYLPRVGRPWEAFDLLREAADGTGGGLHPPGLFTDRNAAVIFDKIYAEFRQNVVLKYFPEGVTRLGWHDVQVTIPKSPGTEVRARRGYLVESTAETPADKAAASAPSKTALDALKDAAAGADADAMRLAIAAADAPDRLQALITDFQAAGDLIPSDPRREFVAALLLANAGLASSSEAVRADTVKMLIRYRGLVRPPLGPDEFARRWAMAAAAMLDAAARPAGLDDPHIIDGPVAELLALIKPPTGAIGRTGALSR